LPGMLTAVPIHPALFGATVKSFDASKAKAIKGVVDVVAMPRGLAVVAEDFVSEVLLVGQIDLNAQNPNHVSKFR